MEVKDRFKIRKWYNKDIRSKGGDMKLDNMTGRLEESRAKEAEGMKGVQWLYSKNTGDKKYLYIEVCVALAAKQLVCFNAQQH